ncbi:hypothetical protein TTHERM_00444220 (macronuclear) [Tetrahymena thermophila SB210]|uniref:Uncharacterized protein n=1 Tax=Tetrahymena thermophila (strain SB210) TaxID=312017 RepID=I7M9Y3_TETTS|nr:hypothetical protein TTHERM_00444220 [Tetrahymena thermophila SB210]EAS03039.1 hypothetical protein TTHERM_00444220 [Tetrahymena thermophila SB210]|eukprot:XP_001023284.1 hypothetical protein TTHERM_00444220 [Tetrahymena thermophila SB210]
MKSLQSLGKLTTKLNPLSSTKQSMGLKAPIPKEQMSAEELGEKKFIKNEKYYVEGGPQYYIAKLLNQKGPLNKNQIWFEYQRDQEAVKNNIIPSRTYLKEKILTQMVRQGKLKALGFDKEQETELGYQLNPSKAFANLHPDLLLKLRPLPNIPRLQSNDVLYRKSILDAESQDQKK